MTSSTSPTRTRLRVAVWILLAAAVAAGAWLASGPAVTLDDGTPVAVTSAAGPVAADVAVDDGTVVALHGGGHARISELSDRYSWESGDPVGLLPAFRWQNTTLFNNYRFGDVLQGRPVFTTLASLLFGVASWIWGFLMQILQFGLTTNIAVLAGGVINRGFLGMFNALSGSGVWALVLVFGLLVVIRNLLKLRIGNVVRTVLIVLVPLGLLWGMGQIVSGSATDGEPDPLAAGSPAWVADRGISMVDQIGVALGSGFGFFDRTGSVPDRNSDLMGADQDYRSCTRYTAELYGQFDVYASGAGQPSVVDRALGGDAAAIAAAQDRQAGHAQVRDASRRLVSSASMMWQRAFLDQWLMAQYGDVRLGNYAYCYQLEHQQGIPASEVAAVSATATGGGPAIPPHWFTPRGDPGDIQATYLGFIGCNPDGSVTPFGATVDDNHSDDIAADCARWAAEADTVNVFRANKTEEVSEHAAARFDGDETAQAWYVTHTSLMGQNSSTRAMSGLVALATSVFYLYALGGIAIGSILAQIALVLLLILLPVTLTLLALPAQSGASRNAMGVKMIKLTGGFMAAKLGLVVVMTLLMQSILLLDQILASSGRGMSAFFDMLIPLAALFLVRKLLQMANIGDITSMTGALGLTTSGALAAATGEAQTLGQRWSAARRERRRRDATDGDGGWLSGDKANLGDWATRKLGRGSKKAAELAAAGATGFAKGTGRYALAAASKADEELLDGRVADTLGRARERSELRREQWHGELDEHGNVVNDGILQRAQSFAGLVGLAQQAGDSDSRFGRALFGNRVSQALLRSGEKVAALDPYSAKRAKIAEQQAELRRQRIQALKAKGASREEVARATGQAMLEGAVAAGDAQYEHYTGRSWEPGDTMQRAALATEFAGDRGFDEEQVYVPANGLAAGIVPVTGKQKVPTGRTELATIAEASNGTHHLPDHVKVRRNGESETRYATRLHLTKAMLGMVDLETGADIDWLGANGIDVSTEWGRQEILKAAKGEASALDDITVDVSAGQLAMIDSIMLEFDVHESGRAESAGQLRQRLTIATHEARHVQAQAEDRRADAQRVASSVRDAIVDLQKKARSSDPSDQAAANRLRTDLRAAIEKQLTPALVAGKEDALLLGTYAVGVDPKSGPGDFAHAADEATKQAKIYQAELAAELKSLLDLVEDDRTDPREVLGQLSGKVRSEVAALASEISRSRSSWDASVYKASKHRKRLETASTHEQERRKTVPARTLAETLTNRAKVSFPDAELTSADA